MSTSRQPTARRLSFAAELAGADALLAWWPPRGELRWISEREWPRRERSA